LRKKKLARVVELFNIWNQRHVFRLGRFHEVYAYQGLMTPSELRKRDKVPIGKIPAHTAHDYCPFSAVFTANPYRFESKIEERSSPILVVFVRKRTVEADINIIEHRYRVRKQAFQTHESDTCSCQPYGNLGIVQRPDDVRQYCFPRINTARIDWLISSEVHRLDANLL
jgi:hypothetical protein